MERRIAVGIASVALCLGGLVVAQAGAATKTVSASGGSVRFAATVRDAKTCGWSSSPKIAGFAKTARCKTGTVARLARFTANTSTATKSYAVTLIVRGKTTTVDHWKVNQARETPPTTTTVPDTGTLAPTTTTTAPQTTTTTTTTSTTTTTTTTTTTPTPYFNVTSLVTEEYANAYGYQMVDLYGTFQNLSSLTLTDNAGDSCSAGYSASGADCEIPISAGASPTSTQLTSVTVSSPGLPSKSFSWPHLTPTVTATSNGIDSTTFSIGGTFTGNIKNGSGVIVGGTVSIQAMLVGGGYSVSVTTATAVSCQIAESLATAESNGIALDWSTSVYTFDSAQGIPVSEYVSPTGPVETYNATTNSWW